MLVVISYELLIYVCLLLFIFYGLVIYVYLLFSWTGDT